MTPEEITALNLQECMTLARSPDTTDEILMLLAQDSRLDVRLDVRRALTERTGLSDQWMNDRLQPQLQLHW